VKVGLKTAYFGLLPGARLIHKWWAKALSQINAMTLQTTEFNVWYDTEHIPALARVPGVLCARRFKSAGSGPK
jgi:hypothetical protein